MSITNQSNGALFEVIPSFQRKPNRYLIGGTVRNHQHSNVSENLSIYVVKELNQYGHGLAICHDNETLTYVTPRGSGRDDYPKHGTRCLILCYYGVGLRLHIVGARDEAVAETAAFFLGLEKPTDESCSRLVFNEDRFPFDFCAARIQCFTHIFGLAPSRGVDFFNH